MHHFSESRKLPDAWVRHPLMSDLCLHELLLCLLGCVCLHGMLQCLYGLIQCVHELIQCLHGLVLCLQGLIQCLHGLVMRLHVYTDCECSFICTDG